MLCQSWKACKERWESVGPSDGWLIFRSVSWFGFGNPGETSCNGGVPLLHSGSRLSFVCESAIGELETMKDIRLPMLRSR